MNLSRQIRQLNSNKKVSQVLGQMYLRHHLTLFGAKFRNVVIVSLATIPFKDTLLQEELLHNGLITAVWERYIRAERAV